MPLIGTFGSAGSQSYGNRGILPGGSAEFNSVNDFLSAPAGTAFQYGTGDFTIEMWIYPTTFNSPSGNGVTIFRQRGANYNSQRYLFLFIWPTGQIFLQVAGNDFFVGTSNTVTLNAWNHVALVRRSGRIRIFLNGIANADRANTTNYSDASAYNLAFGNLVFNTNYTFVGYMTNIRVAKSSYYTANFTPSLTPFTRTSQGATNVQLLLNVRNFNNLTTDSSANNISVTNSSITFSNLSPYTVPYVTPPTVVLVSATVTPSTLTPFEGDTVTFTVTGTNTVNGTYYYTIEQGEVGAVAAADFSPASLNGTFTITSNSGSFTITPTKDLLTEGNESFTVFVRQTSTSGAVIGNTDVITITDSSLTPVFTVTPASMNENNSTAFTVQNVGPNGTYYWTILHGTTTAADFLSTSGSFIVNGGSGGIDNGTGSFNIQTADDRTTEGNETFQVQVRSGSAAGPVIVTSSSVLLNDTSLTPSFTVTPSVIGEGSTDTFTVNNLGDAGTYFWTILNGTSSNADFSAVSGSFTTSTLNGPGSFTVSPVLDYTSEGSETFQVQVRSGSTSGPVLVTSSSVLISDTSTTVTATPSPTTIAEGSSTTISVSSTSLPTGTYFWTILNGTTTNADFTATSGSFNVFLNSGSFTVTAATLGGAESAEFFQVQIRVGSTSGTVIATTSSITISGNAT